MNPLSLAPKDAFRKIPVGSTKGWELVKKGELEAFKIGSATRITNASIESFVARRLAEAKQAA